MDSKSIFTLTAKGKGELNNPSCQLPNQIKHILVLIGDEATLEYLEARVLPDLLAELKEILQKLMGGGYIRDKNNIVIADVPEMEVKNIFIPANAAGKVEGDDYAATVNMAPLALAPETIFAEAVLESPTGKGKQDISGGRSMIATVLFFDVVGYTKQSVSTQIELKSQFNRLVSELIKNIEEQQRIILDTGDGAAIGFLQHPEDAIEVAVKFRAAVTANRHQDFPGLKVRIGIHLGPVKIVKDMNGQSNMVGDGINDAQRIMSFANIDQIYISRPYYEVISRLSTDYVNLFKYRGTKNDKHGREYPVYEADFEAGGSGGVEPDSTRQEVDPASVQLAPFFPDGFVESQKAVLLQESGEQPRSPDEIMNRVTSSLEEYFKEPDVSQAVHQGEITSKPAGGGTQTIADRKVPRADDTAKIDLAQLAREEAEAARIKAEEEARAKAEKMARQMAEEQEKLWADAEQRAKTDAAARIQAELLIQQSAQKSPAKAVNDFSRAHRRTLSLGKLLIYLFGIVVLLIAALPYVWPTQRYIPQLEATLSSILQQPVHIARMNAAWLPMPNLELREVSVGGRQELKAGMVVLNFDVKALFGEIKPVRSLKLSDITISADEFLTVLSWLQAANSDAHYPVTRMELKHAKVSDSALNLPPVNGVVNWDIPGHVSNAVLHGEDGKFEMELQAQQSIMKIELSLKDSSLPGLPGVLLGDINAKGMVSEGGADFSEIDGHIFKGSFAGNIRLTWQNGWKAQGIMSVKSMELSDAFPQLGLEGEMEGDNKILLNGTTVSRLFSQPRLEGSFNINKGLISKIDVVETVANHQATVGGRTHFDELSGMLQMENNAMHFHQLRIAGGQMSAGGSVDINAAGELAGHLLVDIKMRPGSVPLLLSGTLSEPRLTPGN